MKEFQTGAVRDTGNKGRMDLLPWCALMRVSKHMENAILPDPETGKSHYPERNWEKGMPIHCMIDSAFRHLAKYVDGWDDEDHLCAAATNLLMAMWMEEKNPEMQDIPSRHISPSSSDTSSLASVVSEARKPHCNPKNAEKGKEKGKEKASEGYVPCESYEASEKKCNGTRERDLCECNGNRLCCDFYPKNREITYKDVHDIIGDI